MINFDNVPKALSLMLLGMVGIFIVMLVILCMVVILNRVTKYAETRKAKKAQAKLNDNAKNV
ncbi:MAG TPA: hypothetical protein GXX54_06615 [Clostridiales bacterium]|nr:hypothetical protein [Clostridiales bacterium]